MLIRLVSKQGNDLVKLAIGERVVTVTVIIEALPPPRHGNRRQNWVLLRDLVQKALMLVIATPTLHVNFLEC